MNLELFYMNYLDRNEFNFPPSPKVLDAIRSFDAEKFCFYTRTYEHGTKSILSERLSEMFGVEEKRVILGYGAEDILKNAIHFFLSGSANRKLLIPSLSWWYYASIGSEVDGEALTYPVVEDGDSFRYDIDALKEMLKREAPSILLLATPNNPTGNTLSSEELEDLLAFVPQQTIVIMDEAYSSFVTADISYIPRMTERFPNVIFCRTFSKFYGLPGLRMGFGFVGRGERMEKFVRYFNKYLGYDRLSEELALAALDSEDYYREVASSMADSREMYAERLGRLDGFKVYRSSANFILVKYPVELRSALQDAFLDQEYRVKFLEQAGVDSHIRITLGRMEQNMEVCDIIESVCRR